MKRSLVVNAIVAAAALGIGAGMGGAASEPVEPEPEKVTVTEEVVPAPCLEALDEAQKVFVVASKMGKITQGYIALISRAAEAGFAQDFVEIDEITSRMGTLTDRTNDLTLAMGGNEYTALAASCKAAR